MTDIGHPGARRLRRMIAPRRLPGFSRLHRLGDLPGILKRRRFEPVRRAFYSALWREAAGAIGADFSPGPQGMYRIRKDDLVTYTRESDIMLDNALTLVLVGEKAQCFAYFAARGLPVPAHRAFSSAESGVAEAFLRELGRPVVVKPARGTGGGRGVTTGIGTPAELRRAIRRAARFGRELLIEEQLAGASYRLLYLDGVFVDAIRRDAPTLVGDGSSTIRQLVVAENRRRLTDPTPTALSPLLVDTDMHNALAARGLRLSHVPKPGEAVIVKGASNENGAAQNHNVRDRVHPETIARIGQAVRDMGVRFAGVDLIADDLAEPLDSGGVYVNEINANPGLHHHVLISDPARAVPVARLALEHMFGNKLGVMVA